MYALHNSTILHKVFPPELYSQPPAAPDRAQLHRSLALKLQNGINPFDEADQGAINDLNQVHEEGGDSDDEEGFAADVQRLIELAQTMQQMGNIF